MAYYDSYSSNVERVKAYKMMVETLKIDRTIDIMLKEHKRNQDKVKKKVLINKEEKTC